MNKDWKFDEEVVSMFDSHVKQSVPLYNEMHRMITMMSEWFLQDKTNVYDLGTSTGKLIRSLSFAYKDRDVKYIGIDNSSSMVEYAQNIFSDRQDVIIKEGDISQNTLHFQNASAIYSILTLQFIPKRFRQEIINRVYNGLVDDGCFIFVEKVLSGSPEINEIWNGVYNDLKLSQNLSHQHIIEKSSSLRGVMSPITLEENIDMLERAGFKKVDCFFKWGNFAGLLAVK